MYEIIDIKARLFLLFRCMKYVEGVSNLKLRECIKENRRKETKNFTICIVVYFIVHIVY